MTKIRFIAAISAVLMALSVFSFTAYAEQEQQEQPAPTEQQGGGETPEPVATEEPYVPDDPVVTEEPYVPDYTEAPYEPVYTDPVTPQDGGSDDGGNTNNNYYDSEGNAVSNPQEIYVGGGQSYVPPKNIAPSAALYDTDSKKIDDKELSKNDWGDIAAKLKNAGTVEDDGSGDFSFIQNNTAREDNGHWIIIAGGACVALSLAGFIYLIASAISRRKKFKTETAAAPQGDYYAPNDYGDGFKANDKPKSNGGRRYK